MKTVFSNSMVCHLWANRSQDHARTAGETLYFNGPTLFSYGDHFVIGHWLDTGDGFRLLWNDDTHSVTTSKQQSYAQRAVAGWRMTDRISVPSLKGDTLRRRDAVLVMARAAADEAGGYWHAIANTKRRSGKRDGLRHDAMRYADTARTLATIGAAGKGDAATLSAADKRACRALLVTLEKTSEAWPDDNAGQLAIAAANARTLRLEKARDEMRELAESARRFADQAAGLVLHYDGCPDDRGQRQARDIASGLISARNTADKARKIARDYRIRAPKLPDVSAMLARFAPLVDAEQRAEAERDARRLLADAARGSDWALRSLAGAGISAWRHAWPAGADYVDKIVKRNNRRAKMRAAESDVVGAWQAVQHGDSYASAGFMRDAAAQYARAVSAIETASPKIPASHPFWRDVPASELRDSLPELREKLEQARASFAAEDAARIAAWRNREPGGRVPRDVGPLLRLSADGRAIETSWGATVPRAVARVLLPLVARARAGDAASVTREHAGLRVGHFTLNSVGDDGALVIGCHSIAYSEIEHMAGLLGMSSLIESTNGGDTN